MENVEKFYDQKSTVAFQCCQLAIFSFSPNPFLHRKTCANVCSMSQQYVSTHPLRKASFCLFFFLSPFPFSPCARFCWGRLVLMFVQWVKDKKGLGAFLKQTEIERVTNDDNLFWNSPLLSPLCVLQFNKKSSAVVSEILPETHFKATSYCELDSRD